MQPVNLRSFRAKVQHHKNKMRRFLKKVENNPPKNLEQITDELAPKVWGEIDCLSCANCCSKMTPTFTVKDIKRISAHLDMRPTDFKEKWLYQAKKDKDWVNRTQPCQFLEKTTNMCSIYEVRPEDCSAFPHLTRTPAKKYFYIHQQNIEYCPATYKMVEKMMGMEEFKSKNAKVKIAAR